MGTNFYLKSKIPRTEYDCFHIAKTSHGWKPHFEGMPPAHDWDEDAAKPEPLKIRSVADIRAAYDSGNFEIVDEYGATYDWDQFTERVLKFQPGGQSHNHSGLNWGGSPTWDDDEGYEFIQHEFS